MNRNDGAVGDARKARQATGENTITVSSFGLTIEAQSALFDRIADAAHALGEHVCCSAGPAAPEVTR